MPPDAPEGPNPLVKRFGLLGLVVAVAISRLPFLGAGYGRDPDAWRVVIIARQLLETGDYEASRLPGYPVQEFTTALLVRGGPWAVNGMACVMSCVAVAAFAIWLRRLGLKHYLLLALGFACVPVIYVNSTSGMDYVWALAFVMCAVALATGQKPLLSGICAGLAIGTRITSGAMLLPLAFLVAANMQSWRERASAVWILGLTAVAVGVLCYVPILINYGVHLLPERPVGGGAGLNEALWRATVEVWGLVGCLVVAGAATTTILTRGKTDDGLSPPERPWVTMACAAAILLYAIAYAIQPLEAGYLVPIVPFTIALLAVWQTRFASVIFGSLLCISPYLGSSSSEFRLSGPIFEDHTTREARSARVARIIKAARELPPGSIVLAGYQLPEISVTLGWGNPEGERFLSLIRSAEQYRKLKREHHPIYFIDRATARYQHRVNPVDLHTLGARLLPLAN